MSSKQKFSFYPSTNDKHFSKKIFNKREFYINKTKKIRNLDDIDKVARRLCTFNLSSNQKFLKT